MDKLDEIKKRWPDKYYVPGTAGGDVDWLISEVESLRQQLEFEKQSREDAAAVGDERIRELEKQLAEKESTICGMRELLQRFAWPEYEQGGLIKEDGSSRIKARDLLKSSSPTCSHKERAEGITQAETAEQARLINERDAARKEVERLEEKIKKWNV